MMRWASEHVEAEVVMKVDDDVFLGLDNILAWDNRAHRHRYLDYKSL